MERPPLVAILWDLDNVKPGNAITARRIRDAASRLGGGALGGASVVNGEDVAGPADVVAFLGFANDITLTQVNAQALRDEGVDVRRAEVTPDAVDIELGAHIQGFARAWAASARGVTNVPESPPFVTTRALEHAAKVEFDAAHAESAEALDPSEPATYNWTRKCKKDAAAKDASAILKRAAAETERAAFEHFTATSFASYARNAHAVTENKPPKAVLLVVTTDGDFVPAVSFARRACGCFAVTCGDFVPKARLEGGGAQASKRRRAASRRFKEKGTEARTDVGVTPRYWSSLQAAAQARPVDRRKLVAASDAALVWDQTRPFEVDGEKPAAGGVVGVWRSRGAQRGVGRWPSPRPAIPNEDQGEADERS